MRAPQLTAIQSRLLGFADARRGSGFGQFSVSQIAAPDGGGAGTHIRVRYDRIDTTGAVSLRRAGRMHHISIGRAHRHRRVVLLNADLDIRVIDHDTGEVLRHLQLDPTRGYQPRFK